MRPATDPSTLSGPSVLGDLPGSGPGNEGEESGLLCVSACVCVCVRVCFGGVSMYFFKICFYKCVKYIKICNTMKICVIVL